MSFVFLGALAATMPSCADQNQKGKELYITECASCHGDAGEGLRGLIPPLAESDFLSKSADQVPCVIRYGMSGPVEVNGKTYNQPMAGIRKLSDIEITNLINFLHESFGNDLERVTQSQVKASLEKCKPSR